MSHGHYVLTGHYTGHEYLVTVDIVSGKYLLCIYRPSHWTRGAGGGVAYSTGRGTHEQFRGRWLWNQARRAQAWVFRAERERRREDRRDARAERLLARQAGRA